MRDWRGGLAAGGVACLLALLAPSHAQALSMAPGLALALTTSPVTLVAGEGRFHGRRATAAYCLKQNYWWFYRPYTTKEENFPRCDPYFYYPGEGHDYSLGLKPKPEGESYQPMPGTFQ